MRGTWRRRCSSVALATTATMQGAVFRDHLMSIRTISPVDGSVYAERTAATAAQIDQTLQRARAAQPKWREVPIAERAAIIERFCGAFEQRGTQIATEL